MAYTERFYELLHSHCTENQSWQQILELLEALQRDVHERLEGPGSTDPSVMA